MAPSFGVVIKPRTSSRTSKSRLKDTFSFVRQCVIPSLFLLAPLLSLLSTEQHVEWHGRILAMAQKDCLRFDNNIGSVIFTSSYRANTEHPGNEWPFIVGEKTFTE